MGLMIMMITAIALYWKEIHREVATMESSAMAEELPLMDKTQKQGRCVCL